MIIYNVLQHSYDERCSHKSWSSLLRPLLAENILENNGGLGAYQVLPQSKNAHCSGVLSCYDTKIRSRNDSSQLLEETDKLFPAF